MSIDPVQQARDALAPIKAVLPGTLAYVLRDLLAHVREREIAHDKEIRDLRFKLEQTEHFLKLADDEAKELRRKLIDPADLEAMSYPGSTTSIEYDSTEPECERWTVQHYEYGGGSRFGHGATAAEAIRAAQEVSR